MASYKVPQDVEADDKLIGPFSFRQFVYLIIVAMAGFIAWGLSQLFIGLAIIPIPIMIFFGALALPLRKDQPMEIYMAAMVSYYLKPRQRIWDPEGIESLIEVSAPKVVTTRLTKDLSQNEAAQRLSYLANIVDSGGWAIRGASSAPMTGTSMNNDIYVEAQGATDVLDTNTAIAHNFDQMMDESTARMHEEARSRMIQATMAQAPADDPSGDDANISDDAAASQILAEANRFNTGNPSNVHYNPYPTFHQSVIQPLNDSAHQAVSDISAPVVKPAARPHTPKPKVKQQETPPTTSESELTAGIMNLANNPDLSIETIAHEAKRLHKKAEEESDEIFVSLR